MKVELVRRYKDGAVIYRVIIDDPEQFEKPPYVFNVVIHRGEIEAFEVKEKGGSDDENGER